MSTNEEIKAKVEEARAQRKQQKFTEEEMKTIETIKKSYDELTVQLGQLNIEELVLNESRVIRQIWQRSIRFRYRFFQPSWVNFSTSLKIFINTNNYVNIKLIRRNTKWLKKS